jgi:cysteine synthase
MRFEPIIKEHDGILVVRDDYIPGGTKRRFSDQLIKGYREVVYTSPVYGGAQIALAHAGKEVGVKVTIFCAKRKTPHARTLEAKRAGATIIQVPYGYLSNVISKAKAYCSDTGAHLLFWIRNTIVI